MTVVVKYVVVRNGEEKMTFATKKEADAYDKMLDIADNIYDFLGKCDEHLTINDQQKVSISLYIAKNSDQFINILKGVSFKQQPNIPVGALSDDGDLNVEDDGSLREEKTLEAIAEPPNIEKKRGGKSKNNSSVAAA